MCAVISTCAIGTVAAQDLEPRAYAAAPTGVNFLAIIAGRSSGGVVVDPSLPIEDAEATVTSVAVGAGRTMSLFGRTALFVAAVPYAWVDASGSVAEASRHVSRSGLTDSRLKLSVNLIGGRALSPREFARVTRTTIVGVSLTVAPPIGQYDRTKLINIGSNRWAFKPEVGVSRAAGRWTIEGYSGVVFFTQNDEFYPGSVRRSQEPVVALQGHASYTVRRGLWAAFDGTWYSGGRTTVDGVEKGDLQRNSRYGATVSVPVSQGHSLKISGSTGATTRIGADFNTIAVAWQMTWFD